MVKDIRIEDFDYPLPDDRIPRHPLPQRDACRLLVADTLGHISHSRFSLLPELLPPDALLVCNDTRVINARLSFRKPTGSRIEVFLLNPSSPADYALNFASRSGCVWICMVGNLKRWREGSLSMSVAVPGVTPPVMLSATRVGEAGDNQHLVEFSWDNPSLSFAEVLEAAGCIPIPPYLKRESEASDADDYQTVYARFRGSVAAPTAGLHFTPEIFEALTARGIDVAKLTLHVGAGTFRPVKSECIGAHEMHTEAFSVSRPFLERLIKQVSHGHPVVAVGTTSVRSLESLPYLGAALLEGDESLHLDQWTAYSSRFGSLSAVEALRAILLYMDRNHLDTLSASTAIMIAPGFRWRLTDAIITNFHQPQSTLLLLVSSFLSNRDGLPFWRRIYQEALDHPYRFLSYGDACLFFRRSNS